jgi:hypothetical protein
MRRLRKPVRLPETLGNRFPKIGSLFPANENRGGTKTTK